MIHHWHTIMAFHIYIYYFFPSKGISLTKETNLQKFRKWNLLRQRWMDEMWSFYCIKLFRNGSISLRFSRRIEEGKIESNAYILKIFQAKRSKNQENAHTSSLRIMLENIRFKTFLRTICKCLKFITLEMIVFVKAESKKNYSWNAIPRRRFCMRVHLKSF